MHLVLFYQKSYIEDYNFAFDHIIKKSHMKSWCQHLCIKFQILVPLCYAPYMHTHLSR